MKKTQRFLLMLMVGLLCVVLLGCGTHEHVYGEWSTTTKESCTSDGVEVRTCGCGEKETRSIGATGHSFGMWTVTTPATCDAEGTEMRTCICGEKETRSIGATGHSFGAWLVTTPATCDAEGAEMRTCSCGKKEIKIISAIGHSFGAWTVTTPATCDAEGAEMRTCSCGKKETKIISKSPHAYDNGKVTTTATCENTGIKTFTCENCKATKTETIKKTSHKYDGGKVRTAASCTSGGIRVYTCTSCNTTKTETIEKLGHNPDKNNICTRCGIDCPVELHMTSSEKADAKKVKWLSERQIDNLEDQKQFRLMFSLKDQNENWLKVPVIVDIKITNDNGEVVYKKTRVVKTSDYSGWSNGYGKKWTAAAIYIPYEDITPGTVDEGTVSFEIYNDYVSFSTSTLTISRGLPLKATTIILPTLPTVIHDYDYNNKIDSSVQITNITYEIDGDSLYLYFAGEKIYDQEGDRYSQSCKVGWKLYDSDGYIVDSGTFYSPAVAVGEKFRGERESAYGVIKPGETYTLVISNVD